MDIDKYSFIFDIDNCSVAGMKKKVDIENGLRYLKNQVIKDNDNCYVVVKVPKKYLKMEGEHQNERNNDNEGLSDIKD